MRLTEHAARNRDIWNADAPNWVEPGRRSWESPTPWWGMWGVPEEELGILPDVSGLDVVDLGCGTGYWCAWFAKLGARPVGLDLSESQLATARSLPAGVRHRLPAHPRKRGGSAASRTGPSTWSSPSTARRSGATRSSGSRRLPPAEAGRRLIFLATRDRLADRRRSTRTRSRSGSCRPLRGLDRSTGPTRTGQRLPPAPRRAHQAPRRHGLRDRGAPRDLRARRPGRGHPLLRTRGWAPQWPCEEVWVARRRNAE